MDSIQAIKTWLKQVNHLHRWMDDGEGYILFDGWGTRIGEQAKIRSWLRKCEKCGKSMYKLQRGCGNGRKLQKWYTNKYPPLRKLKY